MSHSSSAEPARQTAPPASASLYLKLVVLASGAVLMALEMMGSRIISPYFGSSVYVWGSLIAVFLGALSLGYFLGGRIADRHPSHRLLSLIVAAGGVLLVLLWLVSFWVCNFIYNVSPDARLGTLLTSMILFFPPSVLMGMISPFAVRLAARKMSDVGSTAGNLYALASTGSIIGTLAASFLLIDFFGTSTIILLLGIVLVLLGITLAVLSAAGVFHAAAVPPPAHQKQVSDTESARRMSGSKRVDLWRLRFIVLLCGGALMALQIVASRMISPWFGHGIYVWGSLISVFLAALSVGYYFGGRLADRYPSLRLLASIISAAVILLLVVRYVSPGISGALASGGVSLRMGALLACLILFFPPAALLGMVSPFVLRLAARDIARVGSTAGGLYALSAFGNIIGTLAASFLLIDLLGAGSALLAVAVALTLAAVAGVEQFNARAVPAGASAVLLVFSFTISPPQYSGIVPVGFDIIHETDSAYHHIIVTEGVDNGLLRRNLQFDKYVESAIYLSESGSLIGPATTYTNFMHLPLVFNPDGKTLLMIGGGGGTLPREYHDDYGFDVQVAEIDPKVVDVAKRYFMFRPGEGIRVAIEDGRMHLKRSQNKYDIILIDAFSGGGQIPFHLTTREFFTEVRGHLSENGVVAMNVIGALEGAKARLYQSVLSTWRDGVGFGRIYVFPRDPDYRHSVQNIILIATRSERLLTRAEIKSTAEKLMRRRENPVTAKEFVSHAENNQPDEPKRKFSNAVILTDDYAPVELMGLE